MKKTIAIAAIAALAGTAMAQDTLVLDISGSASWDFQGDPDNEILNVLVGSGANITNISWDVNLTTVGLSWADETNLGLFGNSVVLNPGAGVATTVVNANFTGSQATNITLGADGLLDIEFYEIGFDDNPNAIDSFFEGGSTVTLSGSGFIPTPGSLAVLGLGGLVAGRRRR